jgi:hypothetical protein
MRPTAGSFCKPGRPSADRRVRKSGSFCNGTNRDQTAAGSFCNSRAGWPMRPTVGSFCKPGCLSADASANRVRFVTVPSGIAYASDDGFVL